MFEKKALVDNLADEDQVERAESKESRKKETFKDDLQSLLITPHGRRVLWHYISICGVFRSNFIPESNLMYYSGGQRNVGLRMLDDIIKTNPEMFMLMMKEREKESNNG